jgi:hypothetical protein
MLGMRAIVAPPFTARETSDAAILSSDRSKGGRWN